MDKIELINEICLRIENSVSKNEDYSNGYVDALKGILMYLGRQEK